MLAILTSLKNYHCIFLIVTLLFFAESTNAQLSKPNIIFILGDDVGYQALGVNGGKSFSTQTLMRWPRQ